MKGYAATECKVLLLFMLKDGSLFMRVMKVEEFDWNDHSLYYIYYYIITTSYNQLLQARLSDEYLNCLFICLHMKYRYVCLL